MASGVAASITQSASGAGSFVQELGEDEEYVEVMLPAPTPPVDRRASFDADAAHGVVFHCASPEPEGEPASPVDQSVVLVARDVLKQVDSHSDLAPPAEAPPLRESTPLIGKVEPVREDWTRVGVIAFVAIAAAVWYFRK